MTPDLDKFTHLTLRGKDETCHIYEKLKQQTEMKDSVVMVFGSILFQSPQCFL